MLRARRSEMREKKARRKGYYVTMLGSVESRPGVSQGRKVLEGKGKSIGVRAYSGIRCRSEAAEVALDWLEKE